MPNYRLTHKMTGTTSPATAGYYGQHEQTANLWKLAGSALYLWKSKVTANRYYLGATAFSDATAKFQASSLSGTWAGINSGTGVPVYYEYSIGEAWDAAEKRVFDAICAWLGCAENVDAYRGYLPVNTEGNVHKVNVWMINSGGNADAYNEERTYGDNPLWCNEVIEAELMGVFENRSTAMHFFGAVKAWLKSTDNFKESGNVTFCRMGELAGAPEELIVLNNRYWRIRIPLEILFLTEDVYP